MHIKVYHLNNMGLIIMSLNMDDFRNDIAVIRNKKVDNEMDMIDFDAICAIAGITHERGYQLAISMLVSKYQKITSRSNLFMQSTHKFMD